MMQHIIIPSPPSHFIPSTSFSMAREYDSSTNSSSESEAEGSSYSSSSSSIPIPRGGDALEQARTSRISEQLESSTR